METTDTDIRFAATQINLACFEVQGRLFALDVSHVKEIVRCQEVTPLPKAPDLIEGVIDLRGAIVPVLDLGRALGGDAVDPAEPRARIVIVLADSLVLGMRVAAAVDVLSLPVDAMEDPPELIMQSGYDAVRGVVRRDDAAPVMVLSIDHIIESVYRSGIASSPPAPQGPGAEPATSRGSSMSRAPNPMDSTGSARAAAVETRSAFLRPATIDSIQELRALIMKIDCIVSFPALAVMAFYIAGMFDMTAAEWRGFGISVAILSVVSAVALEWFRRRRERPVRIYLAERHSPSGEASPAAVRDAFACVMSMPGAMLALTFWSWITIGLSITALMAAFGFTPWLLGEKFVGILVSSTTGGLISMGFVYFVGKRGLGCLRAELAAQIPDPLERRGLVETVTLARKLQFVVAGSSAAALIFTMGLAYDSAAGTITELACDAQEKGLDALAERLRYGELEAAMVAVWPDRSVAPSWTEFEVRDLEQIASAAARDGHSSELSHVAAAVEAGEERGSGHITSGGQLVSWRALADGRVLTASAALSDMHRPLSGLRTTLAVVLLIAVALSLSIAWMLAADVATSVGALRASADRMASGDLRPLAVEESEDEIGDLARAFERMGGALRATVGRVSEAADRVEATVIQVSVVGRDVASANAEQVHRIAQAGELMDRIRDEAAGVSNSAHALGESVEESSSSILELGAAGDELSETSGVLSGRVEEVSTSIEQMVRSVKQVGESNRGLSEAASDTSSSMEEMASAMRAVDTTAAKTADLSSDVVQAAETGLAKVRETIDGMHAIRDATDAAEDVIRGLGQRTSEIGAILDVIDDVGDETTLLALNAAIIAAQAGEHGRAFSVVADEIRELADRVLSSTKEIGALIRSVQAEASNAVGAIEVGSQSVASGVDLAAEAGISLEGITRAARESGQNIARIVGAVREQTAAAAHVSDLMERVRGGVDEIRSAGEDQDRGNEIVFRSTVTMREITHQVRRTTEEQSRGFLRLRESAESVRDAVGQINGSLREQSEACTQVAGSLDQVEDRTRSNDDSVRSMGDAMDGLASEAEALRAEVARFQI